MNRNIKFAIIIACILTSFSCRRMSTRIGGDTNNNGNGGTTVFDMKAPPTFNFNTIETKNIEITLIGQDNLPVVNTTVMLMDNSFDYYGNILVKGKTDISGKFRVKLDLPTYYKRLVFNTNCLGIPQNLILNLAAGVSQQFTIGGVGLNQYQTVNIAGGFNPGSNKNNDKFSVKIGTWHSTSGLPDYLETSNKTVSSDMLLQLSSLVPERKTIIGRADGLIDEAAHQRVLNITDACEVKITFAHEGSKNRNVLFYYTYPIGSTPTSINDIDSFYVVLPNTSFNNSGGALGTGNTVSIGNFNAGVTVAFGIAADGWQGGSNGILGVTSGTNLFFATKDLNPETDPNNRQHCILLNDFANSRYIVSFEDTKRDLASCDNDFNDLVFYASVEPNTGVDFSSFAFLPSVFDADGDGTNDAEDEYPTDADRAYTNYYPSVKNYGSIAFEDLWPVLGDFDMNDLVVDYQYKLTTSALNQVKDIEGNYTLRGSGSAQQNSFNVEFPILRSNVVNFSGGVLEGLTNNAVVRVFSDMRQEMAQWNTDPAVAASDSVNYQIKFSLSTPIDINTFGVGEYNPFLWANSDGKNRGYEVHLPNKAFTNLADVNIFGTQNDNTNVDGSITYKSKDNLFWALSFYQKFEYPIEKAEITSAYLKFFDWGRSGGATNQDWYLNINSYRASNKIYVKP